MFRHYFKKLYQRTMHEAYTLAHTKIGNALRKLRSICLDCGLHNGHKYDILQNTAGLQRDSYHGIEWNEALALEAQEELFKVSCEGLVPDTKQAHLSIVT